MQDLVVFGIPGAIIIVALIEFAKSYGLNSKWAPLVAVILGIGLAVIVHLAEINPQVAVWAQIVLGGILCGLAAVGGYSGTKSFIEKFISK